MSTPPGYFYGGTFWGRDGAPDDVEEGWPSGFSQSTPPAPTPVNPVTPDDRYVHFDPIIGRSRTSSRSRRQARTPLTGSDIHELLRSLKAENPRAFREGMRGLRNSGTSSRRRRTTSVDDFYDVADDDSDSDDDEIKEDPRDDDADDVDDDDADARSSKRSKSLKFPSLPSKDPKKLSQDQVDTFIRSAREYGLLTGTYDINKLVAKLKDTSFQYKADRQNADAAAAKDDILERMRHATSTSDIKAFKKRVEQLNKDTYFAILDSIKDDTGLLFDKEEAAASLQTITMRSSGGNLKSCDIQQCNVQFERLLSKFKVDADTEPLFMERYFEELTPIVADRLKTVISPRQRTLNLLMSRAKSLYREMTVEDRLKHVAQLKAQGDDAQRGRRPRDTVDLKGFAQIVKAINATNDSKGSKTNGKALIATPDDEVFLPCFICGEWHHKKGQPLVKCTRPPTPKGRQWKEVFEAHKAANIERRKRDERMLPWAPTPDGPSATGIGLSTADYNGMLKTMQTAITSLAQKVDSRDVRQDTSNDEEKDDESLATALEALQGWHLMTQVVDRNEADDTVVTTTLMDPPSDVETLISQITASDLPTVEPSQLSSTKGYTFASREQTYADWARNVDKIEGIALYIHQVYKKEDMLFTAGVISNGSNRFPIAFIDDLGADKNYIDVKDAIQLIRLKLVIKIQRTPRPKQLVGCGNDPSKNLVDWSIFVYLDVGNGPEPVIFEVGNTNGYMLVGLAHQRAHGFVSNPRERNTENRFYGHSIITTNEGDLFHIYNAVNRPASTWLSFAPCRARTYLSHEFGGRRPDPSKSYRCHCCQLIGPSVTIRYDSQECRSNVLGSSDDDDRERPQSRRSICENFTFPFVCCVNSKAERN